MEVEWRGKNSYFTPVARGIEVHTVDRERTLVEGLRCLNLIKTDDAMQRPACLRTEPSMQTV
jgi:hypothetical protein